MIRLLLLAALFLGSGAVSPEASAQDSRVHVVQPGETLYRIATNAGMSVPELKAFNNLDSDTIQVGQRLRVPASGQTPPRQADPPRQTPVEPTPPVEPPARVEPTPVRVTPQVPAAQTPASGGETRHTVTAGESLFRIALKYDTTVEALRQLNGIQGDQIEVGQRLIVTRGGGRPSTGSTSPAPIARTRDWNIERTTVPADMVHFVEPGETLYSIAARYGFTLDALITKNAVTTAPLVPGMMLILPAAVNPATAATRTVPPAMDAGLALVFPDVMQGRATASGEMYDPLQFTASHRDLPFGTVLLVTNPANGRSTFVRVSDRGPVSQAYLMELSAAAATALDLDPNNARAVEIRALP